MKKRSLSRINANIYTTEDLIASYEDKLEQLKLSEVKPSHVYLCGTLGCALAMASVGEPSLDLMILAGIGGCALGFAVPYIVKKVRIADMDYQIYINNKIVSDLKKEKAEYESNCVKKMKI